MSAEDPGSGRLRRQVIAEEAAARVEELIISGKLAVGDKLPPERVLARELRISRPTLREGIRALSAIGTVRVEHGKGSFVTALPSQARLGRTGAGGVAGLAPGALARLRALLFAAAAAQAALRLDRASLEELVAELPSRAAEGGGRGAVEALVGRLADDRLAPLVELLWPAAGEPGRGLQPTGELLRALAAGDAAAAFELAFAAQAPEDPAGR